MIEHDGKILSDDKTIGDMMKDGDTIKIKIHVHVIDEQNKALCTVLMNLADDRVESLKNAITSTLSTKRIDSLRLVRPDNTLDERDLLIDAKQMLSSLRLEVVCDDEIYSYPAFFDGMKVSCCCGVVEMDAVGDTKGEGGSSRIVDTRSKKRSCCGCCGGGTDKTECVIS